MYSRSTLNGVHSSKTTARSVPSAAWTSIERSGERNCFEPSRYERKATPSSSIESIRPCERRPPPSALPPLLALWLVRPLISSATVPWPIEKTWKPPESVMIGPSQRM